MIENKQIRFNPDGYSNRDFLPHEYDKVCVHCRILRKEWQKEPDKNVLFCKGLLENGRHEFVSLLNCPFHSYHNPRNIKNSVYRPEDFGIKEE